MLTSLPLGRPAKTGIPPLRHQPRSLKQEYQEFILQRLEEYKNTVPRAELLEIGDEAVRELQASAQDQYLLTEVLLLEHVDRIIARCAKRSASRRTGASIASIRSCSGRRGSSPATSSRYWARPRYRKRSSSRRTMPRSSCSIRTWAPSKLPKAAPSPSSWAAGRSRRS
jgi:hypothetical protein